MTTKRRTADQWQVLVDQQHHSGLSARQFCQQQKVGYASFCNWRKRLSEKPDESDDSASSESSFLDLSSVINDSRASDSGWNIVLSLGNGVELRLSQNG
ncbi:hypothetical protein THMIRHAS_08250 [Thiosulfatimonas sediminis]|uniref:Transposase n=1 Tax=Thiosulfatimonas sediminis TaxID=2675054 RepID=A0A6F8PTI3_9GAMM|nr:IS66 family insertion sequence element accessory protein TnpB [Thiosulfatimonas sediminis]BBP45452.1 hypothetical protein THMIRHAS_08250 [Thiosulfatimonas sediminis]